MIPVTGSTGNNGGTLVEELASLGAPVRAMVGAGLSEWLADGLVELNREVYEPGYSSNVAGGVAEATGREPRSFDEFARDHAGAFAGPGPAR